MANAQLPAPRRRFLGLPRAIASIIAILPWLIALGWTFAPSVRALLASIDLELTPSVIQLNGDGSTSTSVKRQIQRHYREYGIYVPLEDIYFSSEAKESNARLSFLMQKACGRATLYVWIPLRLRLPLEGEKVFDWCWKFNPTKA